jgi:putative photosynthetic complex assembly protein
MGTTATDNILPRGVLLAIGGVLLATVLGVAAVRLFGGSISEPDQAAVAIRELRFEDRADGSVAVIDAASKTVIHTMTGENGFFRGTLRGLARERRRNGLGSEQPFQLVGRADGRLTLVDPATGQRIDLESFGPTNAAVFAQFMPPSAAAN